MSRPGRKRKSGPRYPSGDLKRPTVERLNAMASELRRKEQSVVLNQPHRRGSDHKWAESALGRLCLRRKLREQLFDAGQHYASVVSCWRGAKGIPRAIGSHEGASCSAGPSDATVHRWQAEMLAMERAMMGCGIEAFLAVRSLALDDADIGMDQDDHAIMGLTALGVEQGRIRLNERPFHEAAA